MSRATNPQNSPATSHLKPRTPRETVLVVVNGDGWVQVYGQKHVDVRIVIAPYTTTPEGERLAEEYVELTLSQRYRDLYWPGMIRAADMVRVIRPSDIVQHNWNLDLLRSIKRLGKELRDHVQ